MTTDLNELAKIVHAANSKWWQNVDTGEPIERNQLELLALVISELSECLDGERKNLMDDKLPHRKMAEVEMADAKLRLLDFAAGFGFVLQPCALMRDAIPDNKGAAIFRIMLTVARIPDSVTGIWIYLSIAYIDAYCAKHGYDLDGAFAEKMAFNATRLDHTHEARRFDGGKKF